MLQNTLRNHFPAVSGEIQDHISLWADVYFEHEVTTAPASRKNQQRNIQRFIDFMIEEEGSDERRLWTPRRSRAFLEYLKTATNKDGRRRWGNRAVNTTLTHVKTFAKWITKVCDDPRSPFEPFPTGNPMEKVKKIPMTNGLEVERALTKKERDRILDAADELLIVGGRSKDRQRFKGKRPPRSKKYRPYRNRAMIYLLIGTGMRRAAIRHLNLDSIDFKKRIALVTEKGSIQHGYSIKKEAIQAVKDYLEHERPADAEKWSHSPALFLPAASVGTGNGHLSPQTVSTIWGQICEHARVSGKTPHCARHAVGKAIMETTGNVAAVQRQLGHKSAASSMQYARPKQEDILQVLDEVL